MVNQAVVASLSASPVDPADLCHLPQETADLIARYLRVVGLASQVASGSGVTPVTNNLAQQAFSLATANSSAINALQAKTLQRRVVVTRQALPPGDALQQYVITPAMPSQDYEVRVEYNGTTTHPAAYYNWHVVTGTKTETQFQLAYENSPANFSTTVIVEEARNIEA
jgi:hypothetical protein